MTAKYDFLKNEQHNIAVKHFINDLVSDCAEYKVQLVLDAHNSHVDGCNGYFNDDPEPLLAVGMNKPQEQWFPVLIHESCHMDQWIEQCPEWVNGYVGNKDKSGILYDWIEGEIELRDDELQDVVDASLEIELDCEKRSVKKIEEYGFNINSKEYIQMANSYVIFYRFIQKHRKWYKPHQEPYNLEHIWRKFPDYWLDDYSELPQELEELYLSIT